MWPRISISRVRIENFRSIRACDVELGPLNVLVGPNAAGKSNFMDATRFTADALSLSLTDAIQRRGGLQQIVHMAPGSSGINAAVMSIELHLHRPESGDVPAGDAHYAFSVGRGRDGRAAVLSERFQGFGSWEDPGIAREADGTVFEIHGRTDDALGLVAPLEALALGWYAITAPRRAVIDFFRSARFYDLHMSALRGVDDSDPATRPDSLGPHGEHLGHILGRIAELDPDAKATLDAYIAAMIPNALGLGQRSELDGTVSAVEGRFTAESEDTELKVQRWALSEGTLRLGGILAALLQPRVFDGTIPFIGIEEPEKALHPPKLGLLYEVLTAASQNTQVMVTTQSPDLLDNKEARPEHLLAVENIDAATAVGPLDEVGHSLFNDKILSLTELLRVGSMHPARSNPETEGPAGESA
jgi:predicted ATPase